MRSELDDHSNCNNIDGDSVSLSVDDECTHMMLHLNFDLEDENADYGHGRSHNTLDNSSDETGHARDLPWTDNAGITGIYTGQVNALKQPHGAGVIIYKDGTATTSIWTNGNSTEAWAPNPKHAPRNKHLKQRRKNSNNSKSISRRHNTYLHHLDLGDAASSNDMSINSEPSKIASLKNHDFAFVLRSNKQWTYAIIADKKDDQIVFVVDTEGSTKVMPIKSWARSIRVVKPSNRSPMHVKEELLESLDSLPTMPFTSSEQQDGMPPPPLTRLKRQRGGWNRDSGVLSLFD